jgi:hypothetical protein
MKNTLVSKRPGTDADIGLQYATITGRADQWYFLSGTAPAAERALRADSCLIEPEQGDTVLVCAGSGMGAVPVSYILAVLVRADKSGAQLVLPGGVAIGAEHGKLTLSAEQVELNGRDSVSLQAPKVAVAAVAGEMRFHTLSTSAKQVESHFGAVTMLAQSINSSVGRLVQKAKNSFRWTENLDETRAGRVSLQVEDRYSLKAKHASVIADGQVKIDGEKIDLG